MNNLQKYFSAQDLAIRFSVSKQTIWHWLRIGKLSKPIKMGANSTRWKLEDIENFEAERNNEAV